MYVLDEKLGRRKFLKTAGATAAAAAAGVGLSGCTTVGAKEHVIAANPAGARQWGREAGEWIPSCCNMCGGQSGILVHVVNGIVEKIEPNPWNPNNYTNISSDFFAGFFERSKVRHVDRRLTTRRLPTCSGGTARRPGPRLSLDI